VEKGKVKVVNGCWIVKKIPVAIVNVEIRRGDGTYEGRRFFTEGFKVLKTSASNVRDFGGDQPVLWTFRRSRL